MKVYLDNGATTKVDKKVLEKMMPYFSEKYGNPSSLHSYGIEAEEAIQKARKIIAQSINASEEEIIFTSGGTESNNIALKGIAFNNKNKDKNHIITTKIEHSSILKTCQYLEKQGFEITYLDVDKEGFIDLEELKEAIKPETILVSVIHGNNEIGTIQDIKSIGKICKENNILFHTDACQSFTKTDIDVKEMDIDLMTINSHKIHGPKGIGALYVRKGIRIQPLLHGGGQEKGISSGTENVPAIIGFGEAVKIAMKNKEKINKKMEELRNYTIKELLKIDKTLLNGPLKNRLSNNINISFLDVEGEALTMMLDEEGIAVSTGSACSSKSLEPSHVLMAIGRKHEEAHGSIRITLSKYTTKKEINYTIKKIKEVVSRLRYLSKID